MATKRFSGMEGGVMYLPPRQSRKVLLKKTVAAIGAKCVSLAGSCGPSKQALWFDVGSVGAPSDTEHGVAFVAGSPPTNWMPLSPMTGTSIAIVGVSGHMFLPRGFVSITLWP